MRRARALTILIVLAICLAMPGSALLACMADASAGAMAQMACCKGAKPDCSRSPKTLQCCASTDHPQQQNVVNALPLVNPPLTQSVAVPFTRAALAAPAASSASRHAVALFAGTTSPPHLVFSALLI
jgi:hypothetical protein